LYLYITVMEYLDGGELFERVATEDFTLTESDCCLFLRQICRGVQYLHTRNIVHLDLKVMLTKTTLLHIAFVLLPENLRAHLQLSV
jgi:serine/threonine protein kinase